MRTLNPPVGSIKGIQRGTITIANSTSSGTATITSVDTAKTELRMLGWTAAANISTSGPCYIQLTNATTITATRGTSPVDTATASWELTEYY